MKNEKVYFRTSNINLASTLHTLNFPIDAVYQAKNTEVVEFYFELIPELEKAVDDYWNRRLRVEPYSLLLIRKELIDSIKRKEYAQATEEHS